MASARSRVKVSDHFLTKLHEEGSCKNSDPELFFAEHPTRQSIRTAKGICRSCNVRVQCLEYALDNREAGIWGGTEESERDTILRARSKVTQQREQ